VYDPCLALAAQAMFGRLRCPKQQTQEPCVSEVQLAAIKASIYDSYSSDC
jgi:hypothetical protein